MVYVLLCGTNSFTTAIWWHRSGSTLVQIMACCLTAPSHYLNQCWLVMNETRWHLVEDNFIKTFPDITLSKKVFENNIFEKILQLLLGANKLTLLTLKFPYLSTRVCYKGVCCEYKVRSMLYHCQWQNTGCKNTGTLTYCWDIGHQWPPSGTSLAKNYRYVHNNYFPQWINRTSANKQNLTDI